MAPGTRWAPRWPGQVGPSGTSQQRRSPTPHVDQKMRESDADDDAGANAGSASSVELDRAALPAGFERLPFLGESIHGGSPRRVFPDEGSLLVNGPTSVGRFDHELDHVPGSAASPEYPINKLEKQ